MKTQYTQPPWKSDKTGTHFYNENYRYFIDVPQPNGMPDKEWEANKALVSAAPELLKALQLLTLACQDKGGFKTNSAYLNAIASIAKALNQ